MCRTAFAYAGVLVGLFLFAWFAVGLVWITATSIAEGCDARLYNATRGFLLAYVLAIFCCFASICSACCLLCKPTKKKAKATQGQQVEEFPEASVEASSVEEMVDVAEEGGAVAVSAVV